MSKIALRPVPAVFASYQEELSEPAVIVLFVLRYTKQERNSSQDLIGIHILRDEDELGFARTTTLGLFTAEQANELADWLRDRQCFTWSFKGLTERMQRYVTYNQLPIEWHSRMDQPEYQERAWFLANRVPLLHLATS